jgi:hypothetical protein
MLRIRGRSNFLAASYFVTEASESHVERIVSRSLASIGLPQDSR